MSWDNQNPASMVKHIRSVGMPLDDDEEYLVSKAEVDYQTTWNVYDLYELNILCWKSEGYMRAK